MAETTKKTNSKRAEIFKIKGEDLTGKVKEVIREGNVRRIIIRTKKGKTIVEFPLTVGVVGAVLLPVFATIGVVVALLTECEIVVEREE